MTITKKLFSGLAILAMVLPLASCGGKPTLSHVQEVINEAQTLDRNELYKKAMEELSGQTMNAVGNSSRGATALDYFIKYLKGLDADGNVSNAIRAEFPHYNENFTGKITWSQPKNNKIFSQIESDVKGASHTLSMTLIQDGNQIQQKMLDTGYLLNYIPKEWKGNKQANGEPFALQSLNKVFEYNTVAGKDYNNVWDFVALNEKPMFMGLESEPVGKNFLLMLTNEHYSKIMKDAYDALPSGDAKTRIATRVEALKTSDIAKTLGHANVAYSLAFIEFFVKQMNVQTDDGPICNELVKNSSVGSTGLIVYSKLRSVTESATVSKNNVKVAAYNNGYVGIGGFAYKHYLQVLKTAPLPWTSVAFIHFMTTTYDGYKAWGKDIGSYPSNPELAQDWTKAGYVSGVNTFEALNDKGSDWWMNQETGHGRLVIEDPAYVAKVSYDVGIWIDLI